METVKNIYETGIKENAKNQVENIKSAGDAVLTKIEDIKNMTPEQLREKMEENLNQENIEDISDADEGKEGKEGLTDEQKVKIKEETGWSDEIIDTIGSMEEYEIYNNASLVEDEIGGKKCLIRNDIDWEQNDIMGRTNRGRAEQGLSPINKDGKVIELHHIGQHADSPLAELTLEEHRGKGNDTILHHKTKESEIDRQAFTGERNAYWEARANGGGSQ
ncbi:MAG: HNH/ENDO VII family nuclease [Sporolactobacillus sp.]